MKVPKRNRTRAEESGTYKAYAVARDGSRHLVDARSIVVQMGSCEVELELEVVRPALRGKLNVRANGWLTVGPGDASSICIAVEKFQDRKPRRSVKRP